MFGALLFTTAAATALGVVRTRARARKYVGIVELVRTTCKRAAQELRLVQIHEDKLAKLKREILHDFTRPPLWDEFNWHCTPNAHGDRMTARYIFCLDALNYCFWPQSDKTGLEYEHLALGLKRALEENDGEFLANLENADVARVSSWLLQPHEFPLLETRVEAVRELGRAFKVHGDALEWIQEAQNSAVRLVDLIAQRLPRFRDEASVKMLGGEDVRVCFYKRAQILVADVWAAFGQQTEAGVLGAFTDIDKLTIFADYRLPQLLREVGVLEYTGDLAARVDAKMEIPAFSREEVAIRASTVHAVELLKKLPSSSAGEELISVQVDWLLWQRGEAIKDKIGPNHRVQTIFY